MAGIHPTAVIGADVELGADVQIGPYSVIDGKVRIGAGSRLGTHIHVSGNTAIGERAQIHAGAVIGDLPQDRSFAGGDSRTQVGDDCIIREYVTIHRGNDPGTATVVGNNVMLMAGSHVAHNCVIGDHVNVANLTVLAGHIEVGHHAFISGMVVMHQFVRIGPYAMITGQARVPKDVPPFCLLGEGNRVFGPNVVGLRRGGFSRDQRREIRDMIKIFFFNTLSPDAAIATIRERYPDNADAAEFVDFIGASKRGVMSGRTRRSDTT
jgi:UDP-N-acetylglucosamine acyltransferase